MPRNGAFWFLVVPVLSRFFPSIPVLSHIVPLALSQFCPSVGLSRVAARNKVAFGCYSPIVVGGRVVRDYQLPCSWPCYRAYQLHHASNAGRHIDVRRRKNEVAGRENLLRSCVRRFSCAISSRGINEDFNLRAPAATVRKSADHATRMVPGVPWYYT